MRRAWSRSYSSRQIAASLRKIRHRPFGERAVMFSAQLAFRGIYFPQMKRIQWALLVAQNVRTICGLTWEGFILRFRPSPQVVRAARTQTASAAPAADSKIDT